MLSVPISAQAAHQRGGLRRNDITISTSERKAASTERYGYVKQDVQYIDLCDDSDDEDVIVVQSRVRTPLSNVLRNELSNRPSNPNMGRLQGEKRLYNAMSPPGPHPHQKKPRLSNKEHGALVNNFRSLSPPHSPPPTKDYLIKIPTPKSTPKAPKSAPPSSTKSETRVGPFIIDSDSDTDQDDMPRTPVPKLETTRPQIHVLSSAKPIADMAVAQHETQKWWHQLHALAKTKPELARKLIMQRKARLQNSVQSANPSPAKHSGSNCINGILPGNRKSGYGDEKLVPLNNLRGLGDGPPDLRQNCQIWGERGDKQAHEKPKPDALARTNSQLASGVSPSREHEAIAVTSSVSATMCHQDDFENPHKTMIKDLPKQAQQEGNILSTSVEESAISQPSASQIRRDAASSQTKTIQQAVEPFGMHQKATASTNNEQEAKQHISNKNSGGSFEAPAMPKKVNCDKATKDMQKLIRDSIQVQDRRREVERVERTEWWDEEQDRNSSTPTESRKQKAVEKSTIEHQNSIVRAAAEDGGKGNDAFSGKESITRAAEAEPSRCASKSDSLREQETMNETRPQADRKSSGKQVYPAVGRNEPSPEQRHVQGKVFREQKQIDPAVPHTTTTSVSNTGIAKPIPTPVLAPRDPREHHTYDVNGLEAQKAGQSSGNQLDILSNIPAPRVTNPETARNPTVGGFSANSINGQVKLGQSSVPTKPNPFEPQSSASRKSRAKSSGAARNQSRNKARRFGELTLGDAKLYKRKQGQMQWKDLIAFYAQDTGANCSEKHLRKRWQEMCNIVNDRGLNEDVISRAALGDSDALSDLNRNIHGHEWEPDKTTYSVVRTIVTPLTEVVKKYEKDEEEQKHKIHDEINASAATCGAHQPQVRSVYGGKSVNLDAEIAYLQSLRERPWLDEDAVKTDEIEHEEDDLDLTEEDYQQFVFSTLRREWNTRDPENGYETIDDKPWLEYGKRFGKLCDANHAVAGDALKARPGEAAVADPNLEYRVHHQKDPTDGTVHFTISSAVGITETRVERRLRDPSIRTLPHSNDDLTSRRTYLVLQREVTHEPMDDNLLDAPRRVEKTSLLDMTTHTTLRGANQHAMDHWLKTTFKPTSRNLNMREVETEAQRELLCIEFDVDGNALPFRKSITGADGDGDAEYEVWVAEGVLAGPRNL